MAKAGASRSTPSAAGRFAHPFFEPPVAPQLAPPPAPTGLIAWNKEKNLGPLPPVRNNGLINLTDIIGAAAIAEIEQLGELRFHALGDSGVGHAEDAERVAEDMTTDYRPGAGGLNPAFLFHLGDIVYGSDKAKHYAERFYQPYRRYPGKIIAIPGNHDGETKSPDDAPSLKDFQLNFCAETAAVPPQAATSGIFRETMTLPGAYWMLDAPFLRIIGLYSNRLENPGFLEGLTGDGKPDTAQTDWLAKTLKAVAESPDKKALVIATHHPPYSQGGHSGSAEMRATIDAICTAAGVTPDLFLSGHAHNYQRYTRRTAGRQVPYVVGGTGGASPQHVTDATGQPAEGSRETTYDRALASLGYLFITASARQLRVEFWRLGAEHTTAFDTVTLDLATHVLA